MNINKDVVAINEALDNYYKACYEVGYADGSISILMDRISDTNNTDDIDSFKSSIERMKIELEKTKLNRDKTRRLVKRAFEHYYS